MAIASKQASNLNALWDKITNFFGYSNGIGGLTLSDAFTNLLVADVEIWVDQVAGNDDMGTGVQNAPYQTINRALQDVGGAQVTAGGYLIRVKAGTYTEVLRPIYGAVGHPVNGTFNAPVTIQGEDFTVPVLGSGSITSGTMGTVSAVNGISRTVSGAAWATNELKGKFARITTAGATFGNLYPIASNDATSIDIPLSTTALNGVTFTIVDHAVIISRPALPSTTSTIYAEAAGGGQSARGLKIRNLKVTSGGTGCIWVTGALTTDGCRIGDTNSFGLNLTGPGYSVSVNNSWITGTTAGIRINSIGALAMTNSVITATRGIFQAGSAGTSLSIAGTSIVQDCTSAGIEMYSGPLSFLANFSTNMLVVRACGIGIDLGGAANGYLFTTITGCTSHGLRIRSSTGAGSGNLGNGLCGLNVNNSKFTTNGGDGIRIETGGNQIEIAGTTDISGNTGLGIRIGIDNKAAQNNVFIGASVTMTTNTAGDLGGQNITPGTIAALRAVGSKIITDTGGRLNLFNAA